MQQPAGAMQQPAGAMQQPLGAVQASGGYGAQQGYGGSQAYGAHPLQQLRPVQPIGGYGLMSRGGDIYQAQGQPQTGPTEFVHEAVVHENTLGTVHSAHSGAKREI